MKIWPVFVRYAYNKLTYPQLQGRRVGRLRSSPSFIVRSPPVTRLHEARRGLRSVAEPFQIYQGTVHAEMRRGLV